MADFNPSPGPPNDPNYLNYSKVVAEPQADVSGKIALSTAGEGVSGATMIADEAIKKGIHDTAYAKVDKERDQFTAGLEKVKAQLDNNVPGPNAAGNTGSWLDANDSADAPELPVGLESGLNRIQQLTLAKANGAIKINDTQYAQNVLSIAKQLRSQYGTGYRDYIDQEVSKSSGLPVANSYYQNLMIDINRQMLQQGKQKDDVGKLMLQNLDIPGDPSKGVPNMGTYITMRTSNDPKYPGDAFVLGQISSWQQLQSKQKVDAAARAENKDNLNTRIDTEGRNLTANLNNMVSHHIEDNLALSGMPDLRSMLGYFDDVKAGRIKQSDAEVQARAQQLQAYRGYLFQEGIKMAQGPGAVIGMDKAVKQVNDSLAPIDGYISAATDKDTGSALYHLHANQAIEADEQNGWLVSHDRGAISRNIMAGRKIFGDQLGAEVIGPMLQTSKDKVFADLFNQEAMSSVAPLEDARGQPLPRYMKQAIQHGKQVNVPDDFHGDIVDWTNRITDPKMPMAGKDALIDWAFNKANIGVLNEFKMDYRDPNTGEMVPGKYRAYNIMSSPAMTHSIAEASKLHPENYKKYQNWNESEFQSLYRQDLQTLNQITKRPELGIHYTFNDTNNNFGLADAQGRPVKRDPRAAYIGIPGQGNTTEKVMYVNNMLDILDRVNGGIDHLSNVQKFNPQGQSSSSSTAKYLLDRVSETLQNEPNNMVAQAMGKAIIKAKNPEMQQKELDERFLKMTKPVAAQGLE